MPVLARTLEAAGLSTVFVTMMPYWAEKVGAPRSLAVEFPFGHSHGEPGKVVQPKRVNRQALDVLETAENPGTIIHSDERWPHPTDQAIKAWQPEEPSPVIASLAPTFKDMLRKRREKRK